MKYISFAIIAAFLVVLGYLAFREPRPIVIVPLDKDTEKTETIEEWPCDPNVYKC